MTPADYGKTQRFQVSITVCSASLFLAGELDFNCREQVNSVLRHHQGYYALPYGLSATCLFTDHAHVDFLVMTGEIEGQSQQNMNLASQKTALIRVKDLIQSSCAHCSINRTPGLVRLRFRKWMGTHVSFFP